MKNIIKFSLFGLACILAPFLSAQFGGFDIGDVVKGVQGAKKTGKGVTGFTLEQELDLGGSLAVEVAARNGGILKDETLTRRVALIGKALALYSTRPELPWTFAVLNDENISAFSSPGGYVFVTKGLVQSCKSDHQLAAILAHEISHITRRHALKLIARDEGMKGFAEIGSIFTGGTAVSGFEDLIEKGAESILHKGFDPATEFDADLHGTRLAWDTGFPPRTLRDYLAALKSEQPAFSTHPPTNHRVERLDGYLKENGL